MGEKSPTNGRWLRIPPVDDALAPALTTLQSERQCPSNGCFCEQTLPVWTILVEGGDTGRTRGIQTGGSSTQQQNDSREPESRGGPMTAERCRVAISWPDAYRVLRPDSQTVLTGIVTLGLDPASTNLVNALPRRDPAMVVMELRDHGWLTAKSNDMWHLDTGARSWLTGRIGQLSPPTEAEVAIVRLINDHVAMLGGANADHISECLGPWRDEITKCVQVAAAFGRQRFAAWLAMIAWAVAYSGGDASWWQELADSGERAAIVAREPELLVGLLNRSAATFLRGGDVRKSEVQWIRALAVANRLGYHDLVGQIQGQLGALYRSTGRLHKALDVHLERLRLVTDPVAAAGIEREIADTLLAAGRPRMAIVYLKKAEQRLAVI